MKTPSKTPKKLITFDNNFMKIINYYFDDKELNNYSDNDNVHKSIQKLINLIKDDQANWEKQCQYLREIEENLDDKFINQIENILEPIISKIYFSSIEPLTKRYCIPILDSCHMISSLSSSSISNNRMFNEILIEYSKFITQENYSNQTFSQKSNSIYITLDFSLGYQIIEEKLFDTIYFLIESLNIVIIQRINNNNNHHSIQNFEASSSSLILSQNMNDLQHLTKTILALLSKFDKKFRPKFNKINLEENLVVNNTTNTDDGNDEATFLKMIKDLINGCLIMCSNHIYIKDVRQLSGMTLSAIFNLFGSSSPNFKSNQIIYTFFSQKLKLIGKSEDDEFLLIKKKLNLKIPDCLISDDKGWTDDDPLMLTICRGFLSNLSRDVLICPIKEIEEFGKNNTNDHKVTSLHQILFLFILEFCDLSTNSQTKVLSFETLGLWLQETENILKNDDGGIEDLMIYEKNRVVTPIIKKEILNIFNKNILEKLISYVINNCDDPIDAIQHKIKTIFEALLSIINLGIQSEELSKDPSSLSLSFSSTLELQYNQYLNNLISQLLLMDKYRKVKYSLLNLILPRIRTNLILEMQNDFIDKTLQVLNNLVIAPKAANLLIGFLKQRLEEDYYNEENNLRSNSNDIVVIDAVAASEEKEKIIVNWMNLWMKPLCLNLTTKNNEILRKIIGEILLKPLFKIDSLIFWKILERFQDEKSVNNMELIRDEEYKLNSLILIIKIGKSLDFIDGNKLFLEEQRKKLLYDSICHEDLNIRSDLLGLICESKKAIIEITAQELELLKSFLKININSTSPEFRQKLYGNLNKLFNRLEINTNGLLRDYLSRKKFIEKNRHLNQKKELENVVMIELDEIKKKFDKYERFLNWLVELLMASLYPGASFQRVSTSLNIFKLLLNKNFFCEKSNLAYEILREFVSPLPGIVNNQEEALTIKYILKWAFDRMISARAVESDSGAMIFRLVFRKYVIELGHIIDFEKEDILIEESIVFEKEVCEYSLVSSINFIQKILRILKTQINIASNNLLLASKKYPMYGTLIGLQYLFLEINYNSDFVKKNILEWRALHKDVLQLIDHVCQIVLEILSSPSPEGNLPEGVDDGGTLDMNDDDITVDYDEFYENGGGRGEEMSDVDYEQVRKGGELFKNLLISIRHRGAFSAIYPEFLKVCTRLLSSNQSDFFGLPKIWLEENINAIKTNSISITRRSAGLPYYILAIVYSESSSSNRRMLLPWVMKTLFEIGFKEILFMDSKLGTEVLSYVSNGFELSIEGFSSKSWAIRNCSVMLFSTLLQRTFGNKKVKDENHSVNNLTSKEFFTRFPKLHSFLLNQLETFVNQLLVKKDKENVDKDLKHQSKVHTGLYPILTLLSRLHPSLMESTNSVREIAAKALVPLITTNDLISKCIELLNGCELFNQNELHGRLIQIKYLLKGHLENNFCGFNIMKEFIEKFSKVFKSEFYLLTKENPCQITRNLLLEIIYVFIINDDWIYNEKDLIKQNELFELIKEKFSELRKSIFYLSYSELLSLPTNDHIMFDEDYYKNNIGYYLVKKQMIKIIVKSLINNSQEKNIYYDEKEIDQQKIIIDIIKNKDYEVRVFGLGILIKQFEENMDNFNIIKQRVQIHAIQQELINIIYEEENDDGLKLEYYKKAIRLLGLIDPKNPFPSTSAVPLTSSQLNFGIREFWKKLFNYYLNGKKSTKIDSVIEFILPILSRLLSQIWQDNSMPSDFKSLCLKQWTENDTASIISKAKKLKIPINSDKATELCYEHISTHYHKSLHLYIALLQNLTGDDKPVLFAIEDPNTYKEQLLDIQLSFKHLKSLLNFNNSLNFPDLFRVTIPKFILDQFNNVLEILCFKEIQEGNFGPLGFTSKPKVFFVIYKIILALIIMIEFLPNIEEKLKYIKEIEMILKKSLINSTKIKLHPLLNNLIYKELITEFFNNSSDKYFIDDEKFSNDFNNWFLLGN
ncbi:9312_t:CDS:10 [Entrophospora sp. SA101]|nr:9312_t:CDS:10 [Entrophospora sp. SA101]